MIFVLYQVLSEIFLICFYPFLSLAAQFIPKQELHGNGEGKRILIVERWLSINIRHLYWKYYLERKGYSVYLANFPIYRGSFEESALHLEKYIKRHDLSNITIVGISSGAITTLLYLQNYDGWRRVDKFISIGAPFCGTFASIVLFWCDSGRQLMPNSRFIKNISKMKIDNLHKIYCIRAKFDEMVPSGSVLPGAHEITFKVFGHNNLHLRIRSTYRKIAQIA